MTSISKINEIKEYEHIIKLIDLVKKLPGIDWNWDHLSENRNITLNDIIQNSDLPWNYQYISQNPNLTLDFIIEHQEEDWNWQYLSEYMKIQDIEQNLESPNPLSWKWYYISMNYSITLKFIKKYKDQLNWKMLSKDANFDKYYIDSKLPWDIKTLSRNDTLPLQYVLDYPEEKWNWNNLSINIVATPKEFQENINLPWNFENLSSNTNINMKLVLDNINKDWNFFSLSSNSAIKITDIEKNINLPWDYINISYNDNLTSSNIEFIIEHINNGWSWERININGIIKLSDLELYPQLTKTPNFYQHFSNNPNLTVEYIEENINKNWDWNSISNNRNFTLYDIIYGIVSNFKWNYRYLSNNPNLTYDFIYENREKPWNWDAISNNQFNTEYKRLQNINKIKKNYITKKNKAVFAEIDKYLIKDLNKIIQKY
jgi:hypothetical protein